MFKSNCHTHTTYCDGKNTAEEMAIEAINKGFESLGFSGHSPMNFESDWAMTKESVKQYTKEIKEIKNKYKDKIDILCGIELDKDYADVNLNDFDYIIASSHQFHGENRIYSIDLSAEELSECVENMFDGSWNQMAKSYYDTLSNFVLSGDFDVVGHFDLITKFNSKEPLFDGNDEEYKAIAIKAVDKILDNKPNILFEVNTGAMFRKGNLTPYPARFILKHICDRGGQITITSDAHCTEALDFAFDKAIEYCRSCGFKEAFCLTSSGRKKSQFVLTKAYLFDKITKLS